MPLVVYNTLTRQKEPFEPVAAGKVGMYICGPTVYKPSHVGHMVGPVIFDTIKRYLTYLGYDVTFVVNITDVDDKLIVRAGEEKTTVKELAERVTKDYVDNLKKLHVNGISHMPRATEHIGEIIRMIEGLIEKGFAYPAGGDVYFDVSKDPDYGKLCHRDPAQMEAGARIEVSDKKRNPGDFALWKSAKPGEPPDAQWDSPWGQGRPGWHIECSAMSMKYLGETLDIHGGGLDLQFPHHENELAQSESFTGKPFARFWMHNGLMKMGTEKMSKSKGNEIVVSKLLEKTLPEVLRFFLLATHYRRPIDFGEENLQDVQKGLEGFQRFFERFERITGESFFQITAPTRRDDVKVKTMSAGELWDEIVRLRGKFLDCMDDDFNTGGAVGVLYEILTALNRYADMKQLEGEGKNIAAVHMLFKKAVVVLKELSQILGVFLAPPAKGPAADDKLLAGLVQLFLDLRAECRKAKNFAMADRIRTGLQQLGIVIEDRPGGTTWRLQ